MNMYIPGIAIQGGHDRVTGSRLAWAMVWAWVVGCKIEMEFETPCVLFRMSSNEPASV